MSDMSRCSDCAGTGKYTGFLFMDTCRTCMGSGLSTPMSEDGARTIELLIDSACTWADEATKHFWLEAKFVRRNSMGFPLYKFTGVPYQLRRFLRWGYLEKGGCSEEELDDIIKAAGLA